MKFIRRLLLFILIILVVVGGIFYTNGKKLYDEKLSQVSLSDKVNSLKQSEDFVYLKDSEHIIKGVIDIAEKCVAQMKGDYTLEAIEVRQEIKDKASKYIAKETGKRPVILPIIIEV